MGITNTYQNSIFSERQVFDHTAYGPEFGRRMLGRLAQQTLPQNTPEQHVETPVVPQRPFSADVALNAMKQAGVELLPEQLNG